MASQVTPAGVGVWDDRLNQKEGWRRRSVSASGDGRRGQGEELVVSYRAGGG